jgi:hypothetical protein
MPDITREHLTARLAYYQREAVKAASLVTANQAAAEAIAELLRTTDEPATNPQEPDDNRAPLGD